jgi:cobalt-zinc-cadmium efflux system outer membrane protein
MLMKHLSSILLLLSLPVLAEDKLMPLTLSQLVGRTLAANPEIRFYEAEITAAKATAKVAGRPSNPELSLQVGQNRLKDTDSRSNGLAYSVALAQPVEWPGRLGLRKAIANRDLALAELGLERFKFHLASRVRVLGATLAAQQEIATSAQEVADRYAQVREVMVQREPAGIAPQLEIVTIEASALVAEAAAAEAAVMVQKALLELNQLMGRRADAPLSIQPPSLEMRTAPLLDKLLGAAMREHFDLRVRRAELEQQGFKVQLAKNERYPTFTVGPFIQVQNTVGLEDQTVGGIGVSFPLPFWKTGKAEVSVAEARQVQAQATLSAAQREVERQITEATLIYRAQQARLTQWKPESMVKFRESAALADRHYRLGAVPVTTFIELHDKYLAATAAYHQARSSALEAALKLEELTGAPGSLTNTESSTPTKASKP